MTKTSLISLSLLGASLLVGCDSDPDVPSAATVRARLGSDLSHVLEQTAAAGDGALANLPFLNMLSSDDEEPDSFALPSDPIDDETFDPDEIVQVLQEQIFTDANQVEPGIFAVPASLACGEEAPEPECLQNWEQLDLRFHVIEDGDALRFAVQLGAQHDEPLSLALTHASIALSVDLDEAQDAIVALATAFGEDAPHAQLAGALTGSLTVLGTAHVAFDLKADRAVSIAVADQGDALEGPAAFRFATAASHALHLELDGAARTGALDVNVGATSVQVPDGGETRGIELPGLTASVALAAGALEVTNLSLGSSTTRLTVNGETAIAIDLNKDDGRRLDLILAGTEDAPQLFVEPVLDFRIDTDRDVLGEAAAVYDITRVLLTGGITGRTDLDAIEVTEGTLTVETNPASYGFSAQQDQCVFATDIYDDETFTSYTEYVVGACSSEPA